MSSSVQQIRMPTPSRWAWHPKLTVCPSLAENEVLRAASRHVKGREAESRRAGMRAHAELEYEGKLRSAASAPRNGCTSRILVTTGSARSTRAVRKSALSRGETIVAEGIVLALVPKVSLGTHFPEALLRETPRRDKGREAELPESACPSRAWVRGIRDSVRAGEDIYGKPDDARRDFRDD
jgi:hypothetical protein